MSRTTRADNEVPYLAMTCISVSGRRALAFVARIHHVLTDVFSGILSQDLETALAGGEVAPGPGSRALRCSCTATRKPTSSR